MLKAGIVGLPNIGKSTLFNALTETSNAEVANYPFCTIKPNVGLISVPDKRLYGLKKIVGTNSVIPSVVKIVDIAGLIEGSSKGEGLGNQFLSNIRSVDTIIHVIRCFHGEDMVSIDINPVRDIETISTELILSDIQFLSSLIYKMRKLRTKSKESESQITLYENLIHHLDQGKPAHSFSIENSQLRLIRPIGLLSIKPIVHVCNISENNLERSNFYSSKVRDYIEKNHHGSICLIDIKLSTKTSRIPVNNANKHPDTINSKNYSIIDLIKNTYKLLGLGSFFTISKKEVRAWTYEIGMMAYQCAGVIHTDFQEYFINAEIVSYENLIEMGSVADAKSCGKYLLSGRNYIFQDGDVAIFNHKKKR